MQKLSKQLRNCNKSSKTLKSNRSKDAVQIKIYSPKISNTQNQIKKVNLKKFKSIPTITHRDNSASYIPHQFNLQFHSPVSGGNVTGRPCVNSSETELNIVHSISQRRHTPSKHSFISKLIPKSKIKAKKSNVSNHKQQLDQMICLYERTKEVLQQYQKKQKQWNTQKKQLQTQLQKYKKKLQNNHCKSYTSNASTYNSTKYL